MKMIKLALVTIACSLGVSCGPSNAELKRELLTVESEMFQLEQIAMSLKGRMDGASIEGFLGGFAAGYGAVDGDNDLALRGAGTAVGAAIDYDDAQATLNRVRDRYNSLAYRRTEIRKDLGYR